MSTSYEGRILRVLAHIHDDPGGDMSLDRLADVAAMSRFHWHRVFRAMTGETCAQAVRRVRLHRAATLLVNTDLPPAKIAARVGYPNVRSFARAFGEAFGSPPAAFRKAGRPPPPPVTPIKGDRPMYPVTTRTEPNRRLAMLAHRGAYSSIGGSFERFGAICAARGLWPRLGPMIAIYLDNPEAVAEADLRSFAGGELHGGDLPDGLEEMTIAGGPTAVLTYTGHYAGLQRAYDSLFGDWLPNSGHEPADLPCYEIYLNNPRDTAPAQLVTEICLPLA